MTCRGAVTRSLWRENGDIRLHRRSRRAARHPFRETTLELLHPVGAAVGRIPRPTIGIDSDQLDVGLNTSLGLALVECRPDEILLRRVLEGGAGREHNRHEEGTGAS